MNTDHLTMKVSLMGLFGRFSLWASFELQQVLPKNKSQQRIQKTKGGEADPFYIGYYVG